MRPFPVLAALAASAIALTACQKTDDAAFGAKVRAYLLTHPEVLEEMAGKLQEKKDLAQKTASREALQKYRQQVERDPRDIVINPDGAVTVVEFFDFNCAYCKLVAPDVVKLVQEEPDVRLVLKQFAFQTPDSVVAAKVILTPTARPKGMQLYRTLLAAKPLTPAAIDRSLAEAGLNPATVRVEAGSLEIARQISDAHQLAQALKIDGTPAFVVGDQIIHGADIEAVRAAIKTAREAALKRPGSPT